MSRFEQLRIASRNLCGAAFVVGFAAIASGCAEESDPITAQEHVGQAIQPIIRGTTSGTENDAVVVLANFQNGARKNLCSATLVAPNLLVTARHCVSDTESSTACTEDGTALTGAGVTEDREPENLVVFVGKDGVVPDTQTEANGAARGAKLVVGTSDTICNADIAFLILDRKVDAPIAPIRIAPPSMTEKLSAVGWGVDETGHLPKQREVRKGLSLIGVGPGLYPDNPSFGYGSAEFMIGESACSGDSGGPALSERGAVVGVASRAGNGRARDPNNNATTCMGKSAHAVYTHFGAHKELVIRAFQEAGEPLQVEEGPSAESSTRPKNLTDDDVWVPTRADGGCSMSPEPQAGCVEYAAGVVALFATLLGLRRRLGRKDESDIDGHDRPRARMPSLP